MIDYFQVIEVKVEKINCKRRDIIVESATITLSSVCRFFQHGCVVDEKRGHGDFILMKVYATMGLYKKENIDVVM